MNAFKILKLIRNNKMALIYTVIVVGWLLVIVFDVFTATEVVEFAGFSTVDDVGGGAIPKNSCIRLKINRIGPCALTSLMVPVLLPKRIIKI